MSVGRAMTTYEAENSLLAKKYITFIPDLAPMVIKGKYGLITGH